MKAGGGVQIDPPPSEKTTLKMTSFIRFKKNYWTFVFKQCTETMRLECIIYVKNYILLLLRKFIDFKKLHNICKLLIRFTQIALFYTF